MAINVIHCLCVQSHNAFSQPDVVNVMLTVDINTYSHCILCMHIQWTKMLNTFHVAHTCDCVIITMETLVVKITTGGHIFTCDKLKNVCVCCMFSVSLCS